MAFMNTPQCDHGAGQARTPIYLGVGHEGSRSCDNECVGLE